MIRRPPRLALAVTATFAASLGACASSTAPPPAHLAPIVSAAEPSLETAPPAARDALAAGLRRIVVLAPRTQVAAGPSEAELLDAGLLADTAGIRR